MSEPGDRMETRRLTHVPGADASQASEEGGRVSMRFDREPGQLEETAQEVVFDVRDLSVYYGDFRAVRDVTLPIFRNEITA
jgi:hypothetical protein